MTLTDLDIVPRMASLSAMARVVLLVAYWHADEYGDVYRLARNRMHGQPLGDFRRSIAELVAADLIKYEKRSDDRMVATLLVWGRS